MTHDAPRLPEPPFATLLRAGLSPDGDLDLIRQSLASTDALERQLALRLAVAASLVAAEDFLSDPSALVRRESLRLIATGDVVSDLAWTRVAAALGATDPLEVEAACFYVGESADERGRREVSRVATSHDDLRCREAAVVALAQLGGDDARDIVIAALSDKPSVRRRAVVALAAFEGPEVDAAVLRARDDLDWQTRSSAELLLRDD